MGFLLLQKIMRNAYYFTVVILLEKHGVSVSEKNLVPSFNVIVFKVDGLDRGAELVISFPLFVDTFGKLLSLQNKNNSLPLLSFALKVMCCIAFMHSICNWS